MKAPGQPVVPGFQIEERGRKIDEEKKKDLTAEASVSVRFRSKERGTRVKSRAKILPQALATRAWGDQRRGNYSPQCLLVFPLVFLAQDLTRSPPSELRAPLSERLGQARSGVIGWPFPIVLV